VYCVVYCVMSKILFLQAEIIPLAMNKDIAFVYLRQMTYAMVRETVVATLFFVGVVTGFVFFPETLIGGPTIIIGASA
jgi:hypothetical protein